MKQAVLLSKKSTRNKTKQLLWKATQGLEAVISVKHKFNLAVPNLRAANFADRKFWICRPDQNRLICRPTKKFLENKSADRTTIFTKLQSGLHKKVIRPILLFALTSWFQVYKYQLFKKPLSKVMGAQSSPYQASPAGG